MRCNSRYFHRDVVEVCKYMMYLAHIAHMHSFKFLKTLRIFSTLRTAPRGARDTSGSRTQGRGGNNPQHLAGWRMQIQNFWAFCTAVFVTETGNTISDGKGVHFCQDFRFRAAVAHKSRSNRLGKWQRSDVAKWPKSNLNLVRDFLNHWLPPALSVSIQYSNIDSSWMLPVCPPEGQKFGSPTGSFALSEPLSGVELTHQTNFDQRCWAFEFETWKSFEINESEVSWAGLFGFEQRPFSLASRRGSDEIHAALQRHCTITVDNWTSFEPWMPSVELWSCRLSDDFPAGSPVYQVEPSCQIKLLVWMNRNFYLSGSAAHAADQHWILSFGRPVRNVQISGWSQKSCFCLDDARVQQTNFFLSCILLRAFSRTLVSFSWSLSILFERFEPQD